VIEVVEGEEDELLQMLHVRRENQQKVFEKKY
jgi:hypothetical protein